MAAGDAASRTGKGKSRTRQGAKARRRDRRQHLAENYAAEKAATFPTTLSAVQLGGVLSGRRAVDQRSSDLSQRILFTSLRY